MVILNRKGKRKKCLTESEKKIEKMDLCVARDFFGGKYLYHRELTDDDYYLYIVSDTRSVV